MKIDYDLSGWAIKYNKVYHFRSDHKFAKNIFNKEDRKICPVFFGHATYDIYCSDIPKPNAYNNYYKYTKNIIGYAFLKSKKTGLYCYIKLNKIGKEMAQELRNIYYYHEINPLIKDIDFEEYGEDKILVTDGIIDFIALEYNAGQKCKFEKITKHNL